MTDFMNDTNMACGRSLMADLRPPNAFDELQEDKRVITAGIEASIEAGKRLLKIRQSRSYLLEADTFEEFCRANWDFGASRARQICAEARVITSLALPEGSVTPGNASLVRPLLGLPVADRAAAWAAAVQTAPPGGVTRSHVEQVVRDRKAELGLSVTTGNGQAESRAPSPESEVGTFHPGNGNGTPAGPLRPGGSRSGSREDRLREATLEAISKVRLVLDLGGTADSEAEAEVRQALEKLEDFETHLNKLQRLQASRV